MYIDRKRIWGYGYKENNIYIKKSSRTGVIIFN